MRKYYTRACNFYYGNKAAKLIKQKKALPLCGNKNIAFDNIEFFSRDKNNIKSKFFNISQINKLKISQQKKIKKDLNKITLKRKNFLKNIKFSDPLIMGILNLTPDHLDRHITMHKYTTAKCNIFQNISTRDVCYYDSNKNIKKIATTNLDKKKLKLLIPVKKISSSFKNNKKISLISKKHNMQNLYFSFLILKKLNLPVIFDVGHF